MIKRTLQNMTVERIDNFCGLENLIKFLQKLKVNATLEEKTLILNTIICLKLCYKTKMNLADLIYEYKYISITTLNFFIELNKKRPSPMLDFLIDLKTFKLHYVSTIRKLA
jgi:hypothetical protein